MIDTYEKLTIEKYYEVDKILHTQDDDLDKQVALIACLNDCPANEIYNMNLNKYQDYVEKLNFLFDVPKANSKIPNKIKIGDVTYVVLKDVTKMNAGQYIDFQTYYKEDMGIEFLLTTILIPEGEVYGEADVIKTADNIKKNLSIITAMSISNFFQKALLNSIKTTLLYLDWMMKKATRKAKNNPEVKKRMEELMSNLKQMRTTIGNGAGLV